VFRMAITFDGILLATVSVKGRVIKIFNAYTG